MTLAEWIRVLVVPLTIFALLVIFWMTRVRR